MRKRNWIILFLFAFGALTLILYRIFAPPVGEGPRSNGRHLSHWVEICGRADYGDRSIRTESLMAAEQAIMQTGEHAVPYLMKWIQSEGEPLAYKAPLEVFVFMHKHDLAKHLASSSEFRALGARRALPLLLTNLTSTEFGKLTELMNDVKKPNPRRSLRLRNPAFHVIKHRSQKPESEL